MAQILIVEDDRVINELVKRNLQLAGHVCTQIYDGKEALAEISRTQYDLIILDVMLPGMSGFELIPKTGDIPVIFVTAKGSLEDRLKGLGLGAEDYIVKPFEVLELTARVGVVLKRCQRNGEYISIGPVLVNQKERIVRKDGEVVSLTPQEYRLLEVLVDNRNLALSREQLLNLAWGYDYEGETKTVDVHIQKLRRKLGLEDYIKTIAKLGYRLETGK